MRGRKGRGDPWKYIHGDDSGNDLKGEKKRRK